MTDSRPGTTDPADPLPPSRRTGDDDPRRQLRAIIESLADGIVVVDRAGVIRFANPAAARLFTRSPETLLGTELGTPLTAGETTEMEIVRRGGGELVHAELRVVETEWDGERMQLVSLRDVTDRKYAEERARQLSHEREARLEAEAASRTKSDFLAIMSHELRTPLNAILGYSELMELGISGELPDTVRDQVGRIRWSAKHLLSLVNDLLDLAKVEAGRLTVANTPATVSVAVASAMTLIEPQAAARNLRLEVSPDLARLPRYIGDEERVRQVLVNLLSNAVKCTDAGGTIRVDGKVTTTPDANARLSQRGPHLRITVTDTGDGIPAERLRAIFEPFVQADSGKTRTKEGSGLGLTIGQRLARAMGGDLTVESEPGKGSSFSLWLPADADQTRETAADQASQTRRDAAAEVARMTPANAVVMEVRGLCEVAHGLLAALEPLVGLVVQRIRGDQTLKIAKGLRTSQVTDHLPTLLADIAGALIVMEESAGEPSLLLADAMEIQRLVSERHGAQRARLGWDESSLRREFMIIREALERVVRESVPAGGPLTEAEAVGIVNRYLDQAEYIGVRSLEKGRGD